MKSILEVAQKHRLNLIEFSILVELEKNYPKAVPIEEINRHGVVRKSVDNLIIKGIVEEKWQKYRMKK